MIAMMQKQWRLLLVLLALAVLFGALLLRLVFLQVLDVERGVEFLQSEGEARTVRTQVISAQRGMITDRNGAPLAVSTPVMSIWVNPKEYYSYLAALQDNVLNAKAEQVEQRKNALQQYQQQITHLAQQLDMPLAELNEKLNHYRNKQFMYLRRQLPPHEAEQVLALKIKGVYGEQESRRFYPAGEVTSQIVGFTDIQNKGQEGLELAYDQWLQGQDGVNAVIKDLHQRTIKAIGTSKEVKAGGDLVLSIDLRLQHIAYRALKEAYIHHRADAGTAVILDVRTGDVLAMVSQPAFNPNNRKSITAKSTRNRAMIDTFEPGSTAKPLTFVAALESGKYTPTTRVDTSPGYIRVNGKTLLDPVNYQTLDLTGVLVKSSQVGTTKIALSLEQERVFEAFSRLGMGRFSGINFPGESAGILPSRTRWSDIERANFAFGYGFTTTALQLAHAYSIFASGGVSYPVSLLKRDAPIDGERVLEEKYAEQIKYMLEQVAGPRGTAKAARLEMYSVAGKTGTAHKVGSHGYEAGQYRAYFAGFSPVQNPEIVIVVAIDNPKGSQYYGGEVAAPIFAKIAAESLRILNVAPDKWLDNNQVAMQGGRQ